MDKNERMNPDIVIHSSVHEVEFWRRYHSLLRMRSHLDAREHLLRALREETALPEKTRDEALGPLRTEHAENLSAFHDFLVNFITLSMQGLHRVDISLDFSFRHDGAPRCHRCLLHVDERIQDLPLEEGQRLLSESSWAGEDAHPEHSLICYYEDQEKRFDRDQRGDLDRCRLDVRQEIYPGSTFHARLRLPAQVFIEEGERRGSKPSDRS
jgi:hypothetical protein